MRAIVQRVAEASVTVDGATVGRIGRGLLVYVGVASSDGERDAEYLADKIRHLRIFPDEQGRMNRDVAQAAGAVLVVSNFTLLADARQGRRPGFDSAAAPDEANRLFEHLCGLMRRDLTVEMGQFRAEMLVSAVNEGPINILLDSAKVI